MANAPPPGIFFTGVRAASAVEQCWAGTVGAGGDAALRSPIALRRAAVRGRRSWRCIYIQIIYNSMLYIRLCMCNNIILTCAYIQLIRYNSTYTTYVGI